MRVSVIGGGRISNTEAEIAAELGEELAMRGYTVVCGGMGGTMEAVCRGAKVADGDTIGILPTDRRAAANEYVDVSIATGLGHARNALVPLNGDAVVALSGGPGTLSEIGFALIYGRPVIGLDTHDVPEIDVVETPAAAADAVDRVLGT